MSAGYGRGYYGEEQLAPQPPKRSGGGWMKVALVVGVGAVVWYMWPRKPKLLDPRFDTLPPPPLPAPPAGAGTQYSLPPPSAASVTPPSSETQLQIGPPPLVPGADVLPPRLPPQLTQEALARGYPSQQAYEDAVVATARELRETGATVTLAPHLQHLTPRLGP